MMRSTGLFVVALATSGSFIEGDEALKLSLRSSPIHTRQSKDTMLKEQSERRSKEQSLIKQAAAMDKIQFFFDKLKKCKKDKTFVKGVGYVYFDCFGNQLGAKSSMKIGGDEAFNKLKLEIRDTIISDFEDVNYISEQTLYHKEIDDREYRDEIDFNEEVETSVNDFAEQLLKRFCSDRVVASLRSDSAGAAAPSDTFIFSARNEDPAHNFTKSTFSNQFKYVNRDQKIQEQKEEQDRKHDNKTPEELRQEYAAHQKYKYD